MNLRVLVSPGLYGGGTAAVVAALGYGLAASQSVPLILPAFVYTFGGITVFSLLAGTSSFNENSESPDTMVDQGELLSAPTESGAPRRLLLICFSLVLALVGMLGIALLR